MSWRPLLERKGNSPVKDWRTSFFYEYFYENNFAVPTVFAVRTEVDKLVKYPDNEQWLELYNVKADPYETNNLAWHKAHARRQGELEKEFNRLARKVEFRIPDYVDQAPAEAGYTRPKRPKRKKAQAQ